MRWPPSLDAKRAAFPPLRIPKRYVRLPALYRSRLSVDVSVLLVEMDLLELEWHARMASDQLAKDPDSVLIVNTVLQTVLETCIQARR